MIGSSSQNVILCLFSIVAYRPGKRKAALVFRQDLQTDGHESPCAGAVCTKKQPPDKNYL